VREARGAVEAGDRARARRRGASLGPREHVVELRKRRRSGEPVEHAGIADLLHRHGAFFAYFAAASLPAQIAGFAESSGGWTTNACPTRYGADSNGLSFYPTSGPAPGVTIACSTLYASTNPQFPTTCIPTASNPLRPPPSGARIPFGYLAHYSSDDIVSVAWTCYLASALGSRATTTIRWSDSDGSNNHNVQPDFFDKAWAFFGGRSNTQ